MAPAPAGTITRSCPICGFARTYRSQAQAAHYFSRHSCATQLRLAAIARARAEREAGGRRRDCEHPGHPHEHGTLLAYQRTSAAASSAGQPTPPPPACATANSPTVGGAR